MCVSGRGGTRGPREGVAPHRSERKKERATPDDAETDKTANDNAAPDSLAPASAHSPSVSDYPR